MTMDRSSPSGRNRLLPALLPADLALLASHLKDTHFNQGVALQAADVRVEKIDALEPAAVSLGIGEPWSEQDV